MLAWQRRVIFLLALLLLLLAAFTAFALFGPEDPCANSVDYCDEALRLTAIS